MRIRRYIPPPLRPPQPEPAAPPPDSWQAASRKWLDLIDSNDRIVSPCDGWDALMGLLLTGSLRPGKFRIADAAGRRVAELAVDSPGQWRIYSAVVRRR
jgi:hypothetical protein